MQATVIHVHVQYIHCYIYMYVHVHVRVIKIEEFIEIRELCIDAWQWYCLMIIIIVYLKAWLILQYVNYSIIQSHAHTILHNNDIHNPVNPRYWQLFAMINFVLSLHQELCVSTTVNM